VSLGCTKAGADLTDSLAVPFVVVWRLKKNNMPIMESRDYARVVWKVQ